MPPPPDYPAAGRPSTLLIRHLLVRPMEWAPRQAIVYRDLRELTYLEVIQRIHRLAGALSRLGLRPGDRVGVMDWDSHRYLELFFAVPMFGAVLHTINVRLSPDQIQFTIQHAGDRFLLVHPDFLPLAEGMFDRLPELEHVILLPDHEATPAARLPVAGVYESLLAGESDHFAFPEFDENTVATLFYTTGTTGEPKGVFFSHRQIVLHTLAAGLALTAHHEPLDLRASDVYMPLTPMFHVHAWGVPYVATLLGMKQVYPGRYEPQTLIQLLTRHRVTFSHCVPAILQMLLHHPAAASVDWSAWKVIIGGAALPKGLAQQAIARGIRVVGGYGMSETCPIVAISHLKDEHVADTPERQLDVTTRTGFPLPLVQATVLDPEGNPLPRGSAHTGELVLQAPWLTGGYFKDAERSRGLWRSGRLHTGDLAYIDEEGYIRITDRLKDVIKIGGEWISSLELENAISQHPAVKEVAVVGLPDPRWDERPHAEVVLHDEHRGTVSERDLIRFLHTFIDRGTLHKRAILTGIRFTDTIPRTSVGKIDKRQLRSRLAESAEAQNSSHRDSEPRR